MAPQPRSAQEEQTRQEALSALLARAMAAAFALIELDDLAGSLPRFRAAALALVHSYGRASASLAARFYVAQRDAAGVPGRFVPVPSDPAGREQVDKAMDWATRGLWADTPDLQAAQQLTAGAAQKMVTDTGRNTLIEAIQADRKARGWAREARPDACSFCAMLSTRGAVYRSKASAEFKAHDNCHCLPVPLFAESYEPPAHVRRWQQQWRESTAGLSGNAARIAFRQTLEGRAHDRGQEGRQGEVIGQVGAVGG